MSENPSTAEAPVRRRDLHRRRSRFSIGTKSPEGSRHLSRFQEPSASAPAQVSTTAPVYAEQSTYTQPEPPAGNTNRATSGDSELSPRRAAMAAEARADGRSPRRDAMARESLSAPQHGRGSVRALAAGRRGSDGTLLRSVRKQRATTISTLTAVSLAGAATAAVMLANLGGSSEVKVDSTAASEPGAISPETVEAHTSDPDGKTSIEVGAPSAKQQNAEAAGRSISKSVLPGCDPKQDFDKQASNGELPEEWLCELGIEDHQLRADAAVSFAKMNAAYKKDTGKEFEITDSYRNLEGQVSVAGRKPGLAAKAGTSLHGWGIALDLGGGTESKSGPWKWLVEHGEEYGWENPDWAKSSKYEPWHWEYVPARKQIKGH